MRNAIGRPPKMKVVTVRMKRSTQMILQQLSRSTGWRQGKVIEVALKEMQGTALPATRFGIEDV